MATPSRTIQELDARRKAPGIALNVSNKPTWAPSGGAVPSEAPAATAPQSAPVATPKGGLIGRLGKAAGVGGALLPAIPEAIDVGRVATDPRATGLDVATQAAEGAGKVGAAAFGAKAGAALGAMTGPAAPVAVPLLSIAGGIGGYLGGEKVIEKGRSMLGVNPDSPIERLSREARPLSAAPAVRSATAATPPAQRTEQPPVQANPLTAEPQPQQRAGNPLVNSIDLNAANAGMARANAIRQSALDGQKGPGGGIIGNMAREGAERNAMFSRWKADTAISNGIGTRSQRAGLVDMARMAQSEVAGIDQQAADNRKMEADERLSIAGLAQRQQESDAQSGVREAQARGLNAEAAGKEAVQNLLAQISTEQDPAKRNALVQNLNIMRGGTQGSAKDRYITLKGGQAISPDGMTLRAEPERLYDTETRQYVDAPSTPQSKPALDQFMKAARADPRNKGYSDEQLTAYYQNTYGK